MKKENLITELKCLDNEWYDTHKGSLLENVYVGEVEYTDFQEVARSLQNALDLKEEIELEEYFETKIIDLLSLIEKEV